MIYALVQLWHGGVVGNIVTLQQDGPGSTEGAFLRKVCMCVYPLGTPVSSLSPKTCKLDQLAYNCP